MPESSFSLAREPHSLPASLSSPPGRPDLSVLSPVSSPSVKQPPPRIRTRASPPHILRLPSAPASHRSPPPSASRTAEPHLSARYSPRSRDTESCCESHRP